MATKKRGPFKAKKGSSFKTKLPTRTYRPPTKAGKVAVAGHYRGPRSKG